MLTLNKYQNKKFAIYGMGATGISTARTLKKLKAEVLCWDDNKQIRDKYKKLNFQSNKFWLNKKFIGRIVISPGIDIKKCVLKKYLEKNHGKIVTDIDLFFEANKKASFISITGTNGKSTTCKIIEKILKNAKYNVETVGNIGKPIYTIKNLKKKYFFILEASSYQLEYSKLFKSKYAAILNISPDHLERHKNINNYVKIKSKVFFLQKKNDYLYLNSENKYFKIIKKIKDFKKIKSKLVLVKKSNCHHILKKTDNKYFKSKGNIENLAFAYKIAKNLNIDDRTIIKAIKKFKGLPHREEIIFSNKNITCVNDSKATSFDACLQSLSNYKNIYWILGGVPKYKDYLKLSNSLKKNIIHAYVIGKKTSFFSKQLKKKVPFLLSRTLKNAVNSIFKKIKNQKNHRCTILFSPGGASFDQFINFEERGNQFKALIKGKFYV